MDEKRKWTIAIRPAPGQAPRKVTKIIGLNGGGFSVLAPYQKARAGSLFKMPVNPKMQVPGEHVVPFEQVVRFTADDRVKLSYHTDGFAQFSSENPGKIISGRDPETGQPKGLGLFTAPLDKPIWTGPSVGITVWGLDEFDEMIEGEDGSVFEQDEVYYRGCGPGEAGAWKLSIYAFPKNVMPPTRAERGNLMLDVAAETLSGRLLAVIKMRLLHLPEEKVYLGLFVNRFISQYPPKSGWIINGPGDWTYEREGYVLMAIYPREEMRVDELLSLDRG